MFYNTPDVRPFIEKIVKYRLYIISVFVALLVALFFIFKPSLVSSEELFWLSESKAYEKTESKSYKTNYLSRLTVYVDSFDQEALDRLYALEKSIKKDLNVMAVDTLLSVENIYNDSNGFDSSLVKTELLSSLNAKQIQTLVSVVPQKYTHFTDEKLQRFHFYIYAKCPLNMETFNIPFKYHYSHPNDTASWSDYLIYVLAIAFSIIVLFRYLFKNYFSSLIALLIILISLVSTMAITALATGISAFYLSMALIVVAVSLVDYLYFYYRWHVSQYQADVSRAMCKTINRNLSPALWTSIITILGLGTLLFVDSIVVRHLSISVIAASTITYMLNLTLLPALLSYFRVEHPRIGFARMGYTFAKLEMHYNHKFFQFFMLVSFVLMMAGVYQLSFSSQMLFENSEKSGVVTAKLPLYELDLHLCEKIHTFEKALQNDFSPSVKVESVASLILALHKANYKMAPLDQERFLEAKMFLELYGLDEGLVDDKSLKIMIVFDPQEIVKTKLLTWIEKQHFLDLYFTDVDSLIDRAKNQASLLLSGSILTALLLIGLIMGGIFRSKEMILIAFVVNVLPIVWFGLVIFLLGLPLTIEVFIAMTITLALGSDASVHFAYKYFRSRFLGRSLKHSLEKMFFYGGIPVLIGSLILTTVFMALMLTSVYSLQLIGMYGAILMLFSLATDLLILPVMLIAFDRYFTLRWDLEALEGTDNSCDIYDEKNRA